jgi:hypothetical protein
MGLGALGPWGMVLGEGRPAAICQGLESLGFRLQRLSLLEEVSPRGPRGATRNWDWGESPVEPGWAVWWVMRFHVISSYPIHTLDLWMVQWFLGWVPPASGVGSEIHPALRALPGGCTAKTLGCQKWWGCHLAAEEWPRWHMSLPQIQEIGVPVGFGSFFGEYFDIWMISRPQFVWRSACLETCWF